MKVGLFGGIANNMYITAKILAESGVDLIFVRDITDWYPISQPVWEDLPFTISYEEITNQTNFTKKYWESLEEKLKWQAPSWLTTPYFDYKVPSLPERLSFIEKNLFSKIRNFYQKKIIMESIIKELKKADILIVCGVIGEIAANKTGLPYIIFPHGGDIRLLAGIEKFNGKFRRLPSHLILKHNLKKAFKKASVVVCQDPTGAGGHVGNLSNFLKKIKYNFMPIPQKERFRLEKTKRIESLRSIMKSIFNNNIKLLEDDKNLICFIPSRIDFYWKGQDILLKAIAKTDLPVNLICSGWGKDYLNAINLTKHLGIEDKVIFLPVALSKPLLYSLFESVDIVIDQFLMGTYGTSAVEAMACGTPVMMYINNEKFLEMGWEPPPVLNVKNEDDIVYIFKKILSKEIDLEEVSSKIKGWFIRRHSSKTFLNIVIPLLESIRKNDIN